MNGSYTHITPHSWYYERGEWTVGDLIEALSKLDPAAYIEIEMDDRRGAELLAVQSSTSAADNDETTIVTLVAR